MYHSAPTTPIDFLTIRTLGQKESIGKLMFDTVFMNSYEPTDHLQNQ